MQIRSPKLSVRRTPRPVRTLRAPHPAVQNPTYRSWATMVLGYWVATALHSDSHGEIEMKVFLLSFAVGLGVGALYGLIRVKSPAPPIVALLGLLGMVLGEQFGTWVHTRNINVSQAASTCIVGQRYDRPLPIQAADPEIQMANARGK